MRLASLPMYDLPEVMAATDDWWRGIGRALNREGVEDIPRQITRNIDLGEIWRDPAFLFGQTCGYPLMYHYREELRVVATPVYDALGCDGPSYCSVLIVREDDPARELTDLRGRTAAINHHGSQSGHSALRAAVAPLSGDGRFFARVVESGGHPNSLALVAAGDADVCAADCVSYALLARHRPAALDGLRSLGHTPSAPGLPYVTKATTDDDTLARLRNGLFAALADPGLAAARADLLIRGADVLPEAAYERIVDLEQEAAALGYPQVA